MKTRSGKRCIFPFASDTGATYNECTIHDHYGKYSCPYEDENNDIGWDSCCCEDLGDHCKDLYGTIFNFLFSQFYSLS